MNDESGAPRFEGDYLQAGGTMGALIRDKDWSATGVGPPESWPQSLRTVVSLCLASNFPIDIIWGADHTQIYNDGYREVCGDAHPRALGESYNVTWKSAWPAIGEPFERALAGQTSYIENQRMFLTRNGYLEETFFTFSLSPIRDESGGVGGLFHPVTETTATMLAERRTRALRDLSSELASAGDEAALGDAAIEVLSRYELDVPFVLYYAQSGHGGEYRLVAQHGLDPAHVTDIAWPFERASSAGGIVHLGDAESRLGGAGAGPYPEAPRDAFIIPIVVNDSSAMVVAGASPRLPLDEAYHGFFELIGLTLSSALSSVRAREDDRQRAEALAEIDRAKTAFFSNVSHEFRTPLTLMLGPIEEILGEPNVAHREQLQTVHRNGLRLLRLVNSLLDFSRVEAGRADARYVATDLSAFTAELASNFSSACQQAGLQLTVACPPLPAPAYVDHAMWETVVLNLISNAFKFTHAGGIRVAVDREADDAVLTVQDTGGGIPESELTRVFERFHRVESTHGRTHEGSGIGLALVKELVALHGGRVQVASALGEGTTFSVRIPLGKAHLQADRIGRDLPASASHKAHAFAQESLRWLPPPTSNDGAISADDRRAPTVARPTIVLVDDNSDMRDYLNRLLSGSYDVVTANDGVEGLELIERTIPDLVLSDVMMPRLDGFGLVKAVRERAYLANVRVILLSARAGEESRISGLQTGADDYLVKPFSSEELLARVATNLHVAQLRRRADAAVRAGERERRIAEAFQQAALPPTVFPNMPNMTFSAFYEPAGEDANVGGDFYDMFRLLDGRIVVSIGDVAGAGVGAAATMGAVRQSIRAVASVNPDPAMLLKAADDVFSEGGRAVFASAFVAVIDPLTFSIQFSNAGHPSPIVRHPDGSASQLSGNDMLLGVDIATQPEGRYVGATVAAPGSVLVLYTDGLTEAQRDPLDGERRLRDAVIAMDAGAWSAPHAAQDLAHRILGPDRSSRDDVAVASVLLRAPMLELQCQDVPHWQFFSDDGDTAHRIRSEISDALQSSGIGLDDVFATEMIFAELVGNVVRHAGRALDIALDLTHEAPVLHVLDSGEGFSLNPKLPADAYAERGRGLYIVTQLAREFSARPRILGSGTHARAVLRGTIQTRNGARAATA